jgi:hypothetical protein
LDSDLVAEGLQAADVVADGALGAAAVVVEVRPEIGEGGVLGGQQLPDDDQDGPADRDDGFLLASASGDPAVALAEERVRAGGSDGGFAEGSGQVAVAVPGGGSCRCRSRR